MGLPSNVRQPHALSHQKKKRASDQKDTKPEYARGMNGEWFRRGLSAGFLAPDAKPF